MRTQERGGYSSGVALAFCTWAVPEPRLFTKLHGGTALYIRAASPQSQYTALVIYVPGIRETLAGYISPRWPVSPGISGHTATQPVGVAGSAGHESVASSARLSSAPAARWRKSVKLPSKTSNSGLA